MNGFPFARVGLAIAVMVGAFLFAGLFQQTPSAPVAPPTPLAADGPDMLAVFSANPDKAQAREHAAQWAEICWHCSDCVADDGSRGNDVVLKTGLHLARYRNHVRWFTTRGWTYAATYPQMRAIVADYLDKTAGVSAEKLSDAERAAWSKALAAMAQNSQYAAEHL
jgi:hypothetical protein